jgi:chemotaxis protein methyltransferase CheR
MPTETPVQKLSASPPAQNSTPEDRDPAYLKIRELVYAACGIYHSDEKLYLLAAACKRRFSAANATDARRYLDILNAPGTRALELRALLNEITIGETRLFRSIPQLTALQNVILPELISTRGKIGLKKLRIWSAGCSTGEEPYTLSMFLLELTETILKGWTFEITATDLNDRSVETAKAGLYGSYALGTTPDLYKRKYLQPAEGDKLVVTDAVKSKVNFSRLNLSEDAKMLFMKSYDLIFCCNVLIYFDIASKRRVVQHFFSALQAPGYFFLGHAESLYQVTDQFRLVHLPGTTTYLNPVPGTEGAAKS